MFAGSHIISEHPSTTRRDVDRPSTRTENYCPEVQVRPVPDHSLVRAPPGTPGVGGKPHLFRVVGHVQIVGVRGVDGDPLDGVVHGLDS